MDSDEWETINVAKTSMLRLVKNKIKGKNLMSISRLVVVTFSMCVLSGCVSVKQVLPPEGRQVEGGRNLLVVVPQNEIIAGIQESNISAAAGGGLLFVLVDAGVNQSRAKKAEAAIVPVRDALTDYQFDQKALATSAAITQNASWLGIQKSEISKDPSNTRISKAIDESPGPQLLTITYDYLLDNNFQVLKVGANVSLSPKAMPKGRKPEQRPLLINADFTRAIVCVVPLGNSATKELDKNAASWAAEGGKLAEGSIDKALAKLAFLVQKGLERTVDQEKALKSTKTKTIEGHAGKVIETDADGTLLLNNFGQWIYVFNAAPVG